MECGEWEEREGLTWTRMNLIITVRVWAAGCGLFGLGEFGYILISRAASAGRRDGRVPNH